MLLKAALSAIPRPRPDVLPTATLRRERRIDRDHLLEYQRVCGFGRSDVLPVTYPHVLAFDSAMALMTRADFPFPVIGLVHVANRIEQERPLTAADVLELEVSAGNLREHPRGRQFDITVKANAGGAEVWRETSTYLRREKSGKGTREVSEAPKPHAVWRVGKHVGPAYARVSGDHNPIHTSRIGARLFGFARPIAHGMWSKARCLAALQGRLPDRVGVAVEFKLPILLPARVGFIYGDNEIRLFHPRDGRPYLSGRISS